MVFLIRGFILFIFLYEQSFGRGCIRRFIGELMGGVEMIDEG